MEYKVYILRSIDSDIPKYVGITTGKLNNRLTKHLHDIKRESCKNKHKKSWLNKYRNSVLIEQIDIANNIDELKEKEVFYIKKYRSEGIDLLNMTDGGEGSYGYKHTEESLLKMRGENNPMFGKPNLINKYLFGKKIESSLDGVNWNIYDSIHDAERVTGICYKIISNICKGDYVYNKTNYLFRYYGCERKLSKDRKINDQSVRKKEIEAFINDEWIKYSCASEIADRFNLIRSKITQVCNGIRLTTGGYRFRYSGQEYKGIIKKSGRPKKNNII